MNEPVLNGITYQLCKILKGKLVHNVYPMCFNCLDADSECFCDVLISQSARNQADDLRLPFRKGLLWDICRFIFVFGFRRFPSFRFLCRCGETLNKVFPWFCFFYFLTLRKFCETFLMVFKPILNVIWRHHRFPLGMLFVGSTTSINKAGLHPSRFHLVKRQKEKRSRFQ